MRRLRWAEVLHISKRRKRANFKHFSFHDFTLTVIPIHCAGIRVVYTSILKTFRNANTTSVICQFSSLNHSSHDLIAVYILSHHATPRANPVQPLPLALSRGLILRRLRGSIPSVADLSVPLRPPLYQRTQPLNVIPDDYQIALRHLL